MKTAILKALILGTGLLLIPSIVYTAAAPAAPAAPAALVPRIPTIQTAVTPHLPPVLTDIIAGYDTPEYEIDTAIANKNWRPAPGEPMPQRIRESFPIVALTTKDYEDDKILTVRLINYEPGESGGGRMTYSYDPTTESLMLLETKPYGNYPVPLGKLKRWEEEYSVLKIPARTPRKVMYIMEPDNRHTEINIWVADHNPATGGTKLHYTVQHLPPDVRLRRELIKSRDEARHEEYQRNDAYIRAMLRGNFFLEQE